MTATTWLLIALVLLPAALIGYAYWLYPLMLGLRRAKTGTPVAAKADDALPLVSITLPAYNEERRLAGALEALLASDYPADKRQIIVVSDASTDTTDDIARRYAPQGVELLRLPTRQGKTAGENASRAVVRGSIVINTDASVRVAPGAVRALVTAFADPMVGVASGYDVSVSELGASPTAGEGSYVDFEMKLRSLETAWYGIVGASGCLFAIRRELHAVPLPETLSRDFASALVAREHGFRAVSVESAQVFVPRAGSLQAEYRRKVRTMARGLRTLFYKRALLNPLRYGFFAFALWSHKVARWLVYPAAAVAVLALAVLAMESRLALASLVAAVIGVIVGSMAMRAADSRRLSGPLRMVAFGYATNVAGLAAWRDFVRGVDMAVWEPTRRP